MVGESAPSLAGDLPEIPNSWRWGRLGDLVDQSRGICYGIVQPGDHDPDGVPMVNSQNVLDGSVSPHIEFRVSKELHARYKRSTIRGGEILLTLVGANFGRVAIAPPAFAGFNCARPVGIIPVCEHPQFVMFCLRSPLTRQFMNNWANTTAQPTLNLKEVANLPIPLPPLAEQKAIAAVLGALDDKIELNRRMNATLEAMARALFQSWFVDFDPVRSKLDGRPPAALFPEHLEDSKLGHIPKGWEVKTIESLCDVITSGGTPARMHKAYWEPATVPWFKTGELMDGPLIDAEEKISRAGLANSSCKLWPTGTILFALYASPTVGRFGVLTKPGTANQATAALIAKPAYGVPFLMGLLYEARAELQRVAVGAAQQNINQGVLKSHVVVAPPHALARAYSDKVAPWFEQRTKLAEQSRTLATLRDTLLPKLLSGQIQMPKE